jgi:hypothetical protein
MCDKPLEARRLLTLRRAAVAAMIGRPPLSRAIRLTLDVYVPQHLVASIGDLDTFITGLRWSHGGPPQGRPRSDVAGPSVSGCSPE